MNKPNTYQAIVLKLLKGARDGSLTLEQIQTMSVAATIALAGDKGTSRADIPQKSAEQLINELAEALVQVASLWDSDFTDEEAVQVNARVYWALDRFHEYRTKLR
jgi:hypothetical protein